jgi:nucleoid DNA-binding protein
MDSVNKKGFIDAMAELHDIKKVEAERIIDRFTSTLEYVVGNGMGVKLLGSMVVTVKDVAETTRPNPQDRTKSVTTPAHKKVVIKAGKALKDAANGGLDLDDEDAE